MRSNILVASEGDISLTVYEAEKESPYAADGVKRTVSPRTEIYLTAPTGVDSYDVSFVYDGKAYGGDMSFDNIKLEYFFSCTLDISAAAELPVKISYDDQVIELTAATVRTENMLSPESVLEKVRVAESEKFKAMTDANGFAGEIYLRLIYEDVPYYYRGHHRPRRTHFCTARRFRRRKNTRKARNVIRFLAFPKKVCYTIPKSEVRDMKTLETKRLLLRQWRDTDAQDVYEYASGNKVGPMAGWKPHADLGETQELLKIFRAEDETWALELKENKKVIGSVGLHKSKKQNLGLEYDRELGYVLAEPYWGRGLVPEAAKRAMAFAFEELDARTLIVSHFPFNFQSKKVIEKLGFEYLTRIFQSWKRYDGLELDEVTYVMTKERFESLSAETK
ncbi:MAG: GNAT family N-acetyltransferase [Christensenellaceae bacterium]